MLPQATLMVIFNDEEQVLLLQRTPDHKLFPNEWCLPGGKIDRDVEALEILDYELKCGIVDEDDYIKMFLKLPYAETPEESIFRECSEELGLKIYNFKNSGVTMMDSHYHMHVFEAVKTYDKPGDERVFPNREHTQWKFFDLDNLPQALGVCTREFLVHHYQHLNMF